METVNILVVDDSVENADRIIAFLNETERSCKFFKALDGKMAISIAEKKQPDLIITDWEMPQMDGITLIQYLKSNVLTADIPIIMCTGVMTTSENLKTALDAGAVDYIRKPVEKIELTARVHSMLKLAKSVKKIKEQNVLLASQKQEMQTSHERTTASIMYAKRIQSALLPEYKLLTALLPQHFILYKPRDIVSGDFYFIKQIKNMTLIAAADCTGHGVPGAFMSVLGIAILNEIVRNQDIISSSGVLNELRRQIKHSLQQTGQRGEQQDGMDIAFCAINTDTLQMSFAGAYNPCWIFRSDKLKVISDELENTNNSQLITNNSQLITLEADSQPVGIYVKERPFSEHNIQLQKGNVLYLFSDGYHSQFDEKEGLPMGTKKFREILSEIYTLPMDEQKQELENRLNEWKYSEKQTDDILIIGIRV